ncbi:contactin-1-like, partial [Saccostrea cucullata]|uniref:contactin-1-like n=1 Tax=Saccostrea cuccullata TaxID=36930 RepID=UPI002ED49C46
SFSTIYIEEGSDVCISFSQAEKIDTDRELRRENRVLCIQFNGSKEIGFIFNSILSEPFTCTTNDSFVSVCIGNITKDNEGVYSYYLLSMLLKNRTLTLATSPVVHQMSPKYIVEGTNFTQKCLYDAGKPPETRLHWTKQGDNNFRQQGDTLRLTNVHRFSSGTYICTAENQFSSENKGQNSQSLIVDVQYPPKVVPFINRDTIEGRNLTVQCSFAAGNPSQTTVYWTDGSGFKQNGSFLHLSWIQRNRAGTYICTAENTFSIGSTGTSSQSVKINVLCKL